MKRNNDTGTTTANKSMGFDPSAIQSCCWLTSSAGTVAPFGGGYCQNPNSTSTQPKINWVVFYRKMALHTTTQPTHPPPSRPQVRDDIT